MRGMSFNSDQPVSIPRKLEILGTRCTLGLQSRLRHKLLGVRVKIGVSVHCSTIK